MLHIRKGCLSDRLDVNYYYIVGHTKVHIPHHHHAYSCFTLQFALPSPVLTTNPQDGFPKYRCNRGTSPLEGYHHHLRLLIAQVCVRVRSLSHTVRRALTHALTHARTPVRTLARARMHF